VPEAYYSLQNVFPIIYIHLYSQGLRTVGLSQPVSKISHAKAVILNINGVESQTIALKICRQQLSQMRQHGHPGLNQLQLEIISR